MQVYAAQVLAAATLLVQAIALPQDGPSAARNMTACLLPMDDGPCKAMLPHYYYDRYTQTCQEFAYGGCGGNDNNFETLEDCEKTCWKIKKVPKICRTEIEPGRCRAFLKRFAFNLQTMKCEKFIYSGCYGNDNNFRDEASCLETCSPKRMLSADTSVRVKNCPELEQIPIANLSCSGQFLTWTEVSAESTVVRCGQTENKCFTGFHVGCTAINGDGQPCVCFQWGDAPSFCYSPKDEGSCSASVSRYYFNIESKACEAFTYTGCGGNSNNFVRMEDCNKVCKKGNKKPRNRNRIRKMKPQS